MSKISISITQVKSFTRERDFDDSAVIRVFNGHLKALGGRNGWVCITIGRKHAYRLIKGNPIPADTIEMDYDSRVELGIQREDREDGGWNCQIYLSPATLTQRVAAHWKHPDLGHRVSFQLGLIGLVLGALGFAQGILGMMK